MKYSSKPKHSSHYKFINTLLPVQFSVFALFIFIFFIFYWRCEGERVLVVFLFVLLLLHESLFCMVSSFCL